LPFQASEVYAICQAIRPAEAAAAKERSFANLKRGDDVRERENFPFGKEARVRDKIGAFAGMSGRTVEKIVQIHEAAEAEPEKYGDVARAYRRLAPP
jgi:hypothetical protein